MKFDFSGLLQLRKIWSKFCISSHKLQQWPFTVACTHIQVQNVLSVQNFGYKEVNAYNTKLSVGMINYSCLLHPHIGGMDAPVSLLLFSKRLINNTWNISRWARPQWCTATTKVNTTSVMHGYDEGEYDPSDARLRRRWTRPQWCTVTTMVSTTSVMHCYDEGEHDLSDALLRRRWARPQWCMATTKVSTTSLMYGYYEGEQDLTDARLRRRCTHITLLQYVCKLFKFIRYSNFHKKY